MINVIKAVFEKMCENVGVDYDDKMIEHLATAYVNADKDALAIKMITTETESFIKEKGLEDFYDLDYFLILSVEDFNKYKDIINLCRIYNDPCEGFTIEMLVLNDFFARMYVEVVESL